MFNTHTTATMQQIKDNVSVVRTCIFDSIWLPQFPTSSVSLNTVESHCLLCIPTVIRVYRTLENIMGECFANENCPMMWKRV